MITETLYEKILWTEEDLFLIVVEIRHEDILHCEDVIREITLLILDEINDIGVFLEHLANVVPALLNLLVDRHTTVLFVLAYTLHELDEFLIAILCCSVAARSGGLLFLKQQQLIIAFLIIHLPLE